MIDPGGKQSAERIATETNRDQGEKLEPGEIMLAEYSYIAQTAFQAGEDQGSGNQLLPGCGGDAGGGFPQLAITKRSPAGYLRGVFSFVFCIERSGCVYYLTISAAARRLARKRPCYEPDQGVLYPTVAKRGIGRCFSLAG